MVAEAEQVWADAAAEKAGQEANTVPLKALRQECDRKEAAEAPAPKKRAAAKPKIRRAKSSY